MKNFKFLLVSLTTFLVLVTSCGGEVIDLRDAKVEIYIEYKKTVLNYKGIPFSGTIKDDDGGGAKHKNWRSWEIEYDEGLKNGTYTSYYHSGQMSEEGFYKDNYQDGVWINYFDLEELGYKLEDFLDELPINSIKNYRSDNLHGVEEIYYLVTPKYGNPYAALLTKTTLISTKADLALAHGAYEEYLFDSSGDYSGQLVRKGTYHNGRLQGADSTWYGGPDYALKASVQYKDGVIMD